ncbi:SDR family oxidoreductase [Actinophytocola oryzae]|uniref:Uncharacterized protein YbjT (DUF2867 family) n=1 Tax=Actinophytocola oryzae TaxID=502181 RepID=A0A4R7VWI8_9PSEU|nr:NAD(P)H-binding protein [Actinophytocola oryzae]TDV53587.1 uncharacterized protein YbjT (DUF2867 family) [Actinophytocola oryzae]
MTPILVTGGTGTLGRAVVAELRSSGLAVRILSRKPGRDHVVGDLTRPVSLPEAATVVHLATTLRGRKDVATTRHLLEALPGVRHLIYISIVGIDEIPIGYYRGKRAAEALVSTVPHTILRATQFHDLVRGILAGASKLPVMPIPALRVQPVDVRDVAARLAELVAASPQGRVEDFGGPEVHTFEALAQQYLRDAGRSRKLLRVSLPGRAFRAYRDGANLAPALGLRTFADYLAARP